MAQHNQLGWEGEEAACRFLMHGGFRLLHRNWRCGHLELDIVAEWFGELVFVEVKTRRDEVFAEAAEAVTQEKRERIVRAARAYMAFFRLDQPFRFDIVTVVGARPPFEITHIDHAFDVPSVEAQKRRHYYGY